MSEDTTRKTNEEVLEDLEDANSSEWNLSSNRTSQNMFPSSNNVDGGMEEVTVLQQESYYPQDLPGI